MACKLRKRNAPEGYFNAEIKGKEHTHCVAIEERLAKGKRDKAIVVQRGRKDECPSCAAFGDPKECRSRPGDDDAKNDGAEAQQRRKDPVCGIGQSVVADDCVKSQARREKSHDQPGERAICLT